jgi:dolichol-phosphate mannosyltransferase
MRRPNFFVVPAYNEEQNILRLLADLQTRPSLFAGASRVIVVDDGSTDDTAALVESYEGWLPVQLVRLRQNSGPGAAFRAGFDAALAVAPDNALVITLEADTTSDLNALPAMIERADDGADLVLAAWKMVNVSLLRRILSGGAAVVMRRALGMRAHTVSSFFRVYRAATLREAVAHYGDDLIRERGFACKAELLLKLSAIGAQVDEVEVSLDTSRRVGESHMPIVRTMVDYWRLMRRERRAAREASEVTA